MGEFYRLSPELSYELDTELIELLKEVKETYNEQLTPVNDLLDLAKVESGRLELEATSFHMVDRNQQTDRIWSVSIGLAHFIQYLFHQRQHPSYNHLNPGDRRVPSAWFTAGSAATPARKNG